MRSGLDPVEPAGRAQSVELAASIRHGPRRQGDSPSLSHTAPRVAARNSHGRRRRVERGARGGNRGRCHRQPGRVPAVAHRSRRGGTGETCRARRCCGGDEPVAPCSGDRRCRPRPRRGRKPTRRRSGCGWRWRRRYALSGRCPVADSPGHVDLNSAGASVGSGLSRHRGPERHPHSTPVRAPRRCPATGKQHPSRDSEQNWARGCRSDPAESVMMRGTPSCAQRRFGMRSRPDTVRAPRSGAVGRLV